MSALVVETVPCLKDNYAYLIGSADSDECAVVDPSQSLPVEKAVTARGQKLTFILNTHHHADHTGGNAALKKKFGARVIGAARDRARIPVLDIGVGQGWSMELCGHNLRVLEVPGHTLGALAFVVADTVFTGDTLFAIGCGRLFEGDAAMMMASLAKLAGLPDETKVYCGHEYTLSNARFAILLEPGNQALQAHLKEIEKLRAGNLPTIPSTIGLEKKTNPFLRTHSSEIRAMLHMETAPDVEVFAEIRRRKDVF